MLTAYVVANSYVIELSAIELMLSAWSGIQLLVKYNIYSIVSI